LILKSTFSERKCQGNDKQHADYQPLPGFLPKFFATHVRRERRKRRSKVTGYWDQALFRRRVTLLMPRRCQPTKEPHLIPECTFGRIRPGTGLLSVAL
jgi:hypothetical protein